MAQASPEIIQQDLPRSKRLKQATAATHERLDNAVMACRPFEDKSRYGRFLQMQWAFHRDVDALFANEKLGEILPDLNGRRRLSLVDQDLADLEIEISKTEEGPVFDGRRPVTIAEGLGWLYVVEGSNLGAAFLLKFAGQLGLSETFGARHLAGAPEGRGRHWRTFTEALDGLTLSEEDEEVLVSSARKAFERVFVHVNEKMAD